MSARVFSRVARESAAWISRSKIAAGRTTCAVALVCAAACNGANTNTSSGGGTDSSQPGGSHPPAPTTGVAVAIGLNSVDPAHYGGWAGKLTGCEPDARDMKDIATAAGLQAKTLLTQQATRAATLAEISSAAARLRANDLFVLSYSGHGGQVPDLNGDDSGADGDGMDETWCLFDGELLDDELYAALGAFAPGVRVLVFSDSCHSGTILRQKDFDLNQPERDRELKDGWTEKSKPTAVRAMSASAPTAITMRAMPPDVAVDTYRRNQKFYDGINARIARDVRANVKCQAILISGCADDQLSADMGGNGLFTLEVKQVWSHGAFAGGHRVFQQAIRTAVLQNNPSQAPDFFTVGVPIAGFEAQKPYTLTAP